jgi:hypothetical protein
VNNAAQTPLFRINFQHMESMVEAGAPKKGGPDQGPLESTDSCQEETSKNAFLQKRRSVVVSATCAAT